MTYDPNLAKAHKVLAVTDALLAKHGIDVIQHGNLIARQADPFMAGEAWESIARQAGIKPDEDIRQLVINLYRGRGKAANSSDPQADPFEGLT